MAYRKTDSDIKNDNLFHQFAHIIYIEVSLASVNILKSEMQPSAVFRTNIYQHAIYYVLQ